MPKKPYKKIKIFLVKMQANFHVNKKKTPNFNGELKM